MTEPVLSDRALNRATLQRQLLLQRSTLAPDEVVRRLVGLQAQEPPDPYVALWSRIEGFDPEVVSTGLEDRTLVRMVVMRGTIHLVTADDALVLRPLVQPVLDGELTRHSEFKDALAALDLGPIMATLRPLVSDTPRSGDRAAGADRRHLPRPRRPGPGLRLPEPARHGAGPASGPLAPEQPGPHDPPRRLAGPAGGHGPVARRRGPPLPGPPSGPRRWPT